MHSSFRNVYNIVELRNLFGKFNFKYRLFYTVSVYIMRTIYFADNL